MLPETTPFATAAVVLAMILDELGSCHRLLLSPPTSTTPLAASAVPVVPAVVSFIPPLEVAIVASHTITAPLDAATITIVEVVFPAVVLATTVDLVVTVSTVVVKVTTTIEAPPTVAFVTQIVVTFLVATIVIPGITVVLWLLPSRPSYHFTFSRSSIFHSFAGFVLSGGGGGGGGCHLSCEPDWIFCVLGVSISVSFCSCKFDHESGWIAPSSSACILLM